LKSVFHRNLQIFVIWDNDLARLTTHYPEAMVATIVSKQLQSQRMKFTFCCFADSKKVFYD